MTKSRLEAFSDGVIAIILTIMVLELKVPHGTEVESLRPLLPVFLSYLLSFVFIGIYWNNHHHMLHAASKVTGGILWANLHLLFWLSLVPFTTAWWGNNPGAPVPTSLYGVVLLLSAVAYWVLQATIVAAHPDGVLARAIGRDVKGKLSIALYAVAIAGAALSPRLAAAIGRDRKGKASVGIYAAAIPLAFVSTWVAVALYVAVAVMWFVPDRRIETTLRDDRA